jgi:hypothetical protein
MKEAPANVGKYVSGAVQKWAGRVGDGIKGAANAYAEASGRLGNVNASAANAGTYLGAI